MRIFQIGAAGGIGTRLSELLAARGDDVTGMHRKASQAEGIAATGATPVTGDLIADDVDTLATKFNGHDAVVFSAGAHGTGREQTTLIDGEGLKKSVAAAAKAGARRFVLVSAFPESARDAGLGEGFEHYMRVKKSADVHLAASDLDWLIVRPGLLRDEPGDGKVTAGLAVDYGDVRRDNVAAFIDAALHERTLSRVIVELTDGPTPVAKAATTVAKSTGPRSSLAPRPDAHPLAVTRTCRTESDHEGEKEPGVDPDGGQHHSIVEASSDRQPEFRAVWNCSSGSSRSGSSGRT